MSTAKRPVRIVAPDPIIRLPIGDEVLFEELYTNPDKHTLPDHTHLPDKDDTIVENFQEHPQSVLLTDSILLHLGRRHPDGRFAIGQDCGIYWKLVDPPQRGAICPDWCYIPGVPPMLDGRYRRSYVLWQEEVPPLIVLEFVSGDGSEEHDRTPMTGKFWVYERVIKPRFYGIFDVAAGRFEMYHLVDGRFVRLAPNDRNRFSIVGMGVEIGIWEGPFLSMTGPWMRWWDEEGSLLPTGHELAEFEANRARLEAGRAEREAARATREAERATREAERAKHETERATREAERADRETERADREAGLAIREAERAERMAAQLRALGIDPEA